MKHNQISALLIVLGGKEVPVTTTGKGFSGGRGLFRGHPGPRPSFCLFSSVDTGHFVSLCTGGDPAASWCSGGFGGEGAGIVEDTNEEGGGGGFTNIGFKRGRSGVPVEDVIKTDADTFRVLPAISFESPLLLRFF